MAKEISFPDTTGLTEYVNLTNSVGQWYNTAGSAFEDFNAANWTDYDIAAVEDGSSGIYFADMPAVARGDYGVVARRRAGGSPAQSDLVVGEGQIAWTGTAVAGLASTLFAAQSVLGEVDNVTYGLSAIKGDTGAMQARLPASPAAVGDIPTANQNAAAVLDLTAGVETGLTLRQAMRLIAAAAAGKISGAATTTIVIRNAVADSKDRITATVDADGNRSAITVDLT